MPSRPRRVCMVTHSIYAGDTRIMRYADSLVARGDEVDVVGLHAPGETSTVEMLHGVRVQTIQARLANNLHSKLDYLFPLLRFFFVSSWWLTRHHYRKKYDVIHVHNIPDFLVFAAWYPKLTGTPIVLDIHDVVPEFFASKFKTTPTGFFFWSLRLMERLSAAFSNAIILGNDLWLDTYGRRTHTTARCVPLVNYVDTGIFIPQPRTRRDGKLVMIFPGSLQWHQGVDIAIRAFPQVVAAVPNAEFHIYGDGHAHDSLVALARELGVEKQVRFFAPVKTRQIAAIMAQADIGVVPKRSDSFGNEAYSTKIMEFMAVGVPAVISSTKIDRFYFDDRVVRFFPSGDSAALAASLIELLRDPELRRQMNARASEYVTLNSWGVKQGIYLSMVDQLCSSR